jgi:hypothetical protein
MSQSYVLFPNRGKEKPNEEKEGHQQQTNDWKDSKMKHTGPGIIITKQRKKKRKTSH